MQIRQLITAGATLKDPSLHGIVNDLIDEAAPLAVHNRNYVINNVPADLMVEANGSIISSVLNNLVDTALRNTQNSVILISAKIYGHVVLVQLKSKGSVSPAMTEAINRACLKAEKTGGIIELTHYETEQVSIAYCFLNVAGEA
jgi:signal transduction histidine kinase